MGGQLGRPVAGIYLPHRRRAAALSRYSRASLSGSRRLEGPGRKGVPGRVPSARGEAGSSAKPRENAEWGWGDPAGTKAPGFLWLRRLHPSLYPGPDPSGTGPRGTLGSPRGCAPPARENEEGASRGGNFVSTRFSWDRKPRFLEGGTGGVSSPEAAGSRALFSLEVRDRRYR